MINIIIEKENENGLLLEDLKKNINLNNLIIEIIFKVESLTNNYDNIFDLNINNQDKGPRLEFNNDGILSLVYNFSNDYSMLMGYHICNNIEINKLYSLKIFFFSNPYYFRVIFNNEIKDYKLDVKYNINDNNFNTDIIRISGGWDNTRNFNCGKLYLFRLYNIDKLCNHGILMSYNKIQKFYTNIIFNDHSEHINNYIYINNKNKKLCNTLMSIENYTERDSINECRFYLENYNYIFNLNIILNTKFTVSCFLSEEKYELFFSENIIDTYNYTDKIYYRVYYFKNIINKNYFMLFTAWEYNIPYFVYYPDTNILYNICLDSPSGYQLEHVNSITIKYIKDKLLHNEFINLYFYNKYNTFYYAIGFISNLGHYFWQEILGLIFLIETNLIMKITNIIIGNVDCLNFKNILKKKYNHLNIIDCNNINYSNSIIINLNCTYMSSFIIEKFKKIYFEFYINEKINNLYNKENNKIITFIIRNGLTRNVENNFEIISETMNYFTEKYNNFNFIFYITGFFFYGDNNDLSLNIDNNIVNIQNIFINDLKVKYPNLNIINLIGCNIQDIINIFKITDFLYDETGTSSLFSNTLFDFKSIWSTDLINYDNFLSQNRLLNMMNKVIPIPKKYILMINNNSYNINKNGYLKTLNNIIHFNQSPVVSQSSSSQAAAPTLALGADTYRSARNWKKRNGKWVV